jgi:hypothetical protein
MSSSRIIAAPERWRVRLCRWLYRGLLSIWGTLLLNVLIGSVANLNTIPTNKLTDTLSQLFIVRFVEVFPFQVIASLSVLALFTFLSCFGSQGQDTTLPVYSLSKQNRVHMLRRLRVLYEQMLSKSLEGAVQLELGLAPVSNAVQHPVSLSLRLPDQPVPSFSSGLSLVDAYEQTRQELLLLGEPGAGKSTLLLKLALYLTEQAEKDTAQLLPILLPLSSWAAHRQSLQDWLSEQVALLYHVPRRLSQQWIETEQLLFLLDGLDEMEASARPACITAINAYHREHLQPLIVCSRTDEYHAASMQERLVLHTAVVVQPLSPKQVDTYLVSLGQPLVALRTALRKNPALQAMATTPLMLMVLMLTYQGVKIRELPKRRVLLQQRIWNDYIKRMVERKGNKERYPLKRVYMWLGCLAQQMRLGNQTVLFLEHIQPDWLPKKQRIFYRGSVVLIIVLMALLFEELMWLLIFGVPEILLKGVTSSLEWFPDALFGVAGQALIMGLAFGLYVGFRAIQPSEVLTWSWSNIRSRLLIGLSMGLSGGAALLIFRRLITKMTEKQLTKQLSLVPNEGIRRSAKNGLLVGFPLGLLAGVFYALFASVLIQVVSEPYKIPFFAEFLFALLEGLLYGLFSGFLMALVFGLGAFVQHYVLRFWLWRTHIFPWKAVSFLEDASGRILLRRVGGGYSFAHRLLLEYFADLRSKR